MTYLDLATALRHRRWVQLGVGAVLAAASIIIFGAAPRGVDATQTWLEARQTTAQSSALQLRDGANGSSGEQAALEAIARGLQLRVPREDATSIVLGEFERVADSVGVAVVRFAPEPSLHEGIVRTLPLEVAVEGPFHNAAAFLTGAERSRYLLRVRSYSLEALDEGGQNVRLNLFLSAITIDA